MEQNIIIGNRTVTTYEFQNTKEVEVDSVVSFKVNSNESITVSEMCDQYFDWNLSKEELCTFIKLLVSHLELPMEFK